MTGLPALWRAWDEVVGSELAGLAWPAGHRADILLLGCADSCGMQEARMRGREYLAKVNAWLGSDYFSDVRVRLKRPDVRLGLSAAKGRKPRSAQAQGPYAQTRPSGKYLAVMCSDSPVARCYARFSNAPAGTREPCGVRVDGASRRQEV